MNDMERETEALRQELADQRRRLGLAERVISLSLELPSCPERSALLNAPAAERPEVIRRAEEKLKSLHGNGRLQDGFR